MTENVACPAGSRYAAQFNPAHLPVHVHPNGVICLGDANGENDGGARSKAQQLIPAGYRKRGW